MATYASLVADALRDLGAIGSGQSPAAQEATDGLATLNRILETWNKDELMSNGYGTVGTALVAGTENYTFATSGAPPIVVVNPLPLKLVVAYVATTAGTAILRNPIEIIGPERFNREVSELTVSAAIPKFLVYGYVSPTSASVTLWPKPAITNVLQVIYPNLIGGLPFGGSTVVGLPPAYELALVKQLAVSLYPQYPRAGGLDPVLAKDAESLVALIRDENRATVEALRRSIPASAADVLQAQKIVQGG